MSNERIVKQNSIPRNSSIELLRIIAMFMIVSCHFATHGGFSFDAQTLSIPRFWWNVLELGGNFGVDVFVLISGYFLINSKGVSFKRILKFWGAIFFYSIVIYFIFGIAGVSELGIDSLIKAIFPITSGSWWFASTYLVLYIVHPFINMLLHKLDKIMYQKLLVMLLVLWCIIPTFTSSKYQSNSLLWFVTLYSVAGYIRLFGLNPKFTVKHYLMSWILFFSLRYLSCVILILLGTRISFAYNHTLFFYGQQSMLTFLSALSLFMVFEQKNMEYHKWINIIASASFGVYLIHDSNIVRPFLWLNVFKNAQYQDSIMIVPYSIIVVSIIYVICTFIDLLRQKIFEKPYMMIVNQYSESWIKPFERICNFFKNIIFGK